jgi:hypothetical protein
MTRLVRVIEFGRIVDFSTRVIVKSYSIDLVNLISASERRFQTSSGVTSVVHDEYEN